VKQLVQTAERLADVFDALSLEYAIGGGFAAVLWGTVRTTVDVDCLVSIPALSYQRLADELSKIDVHFAEDQSEHEIDAARLRQVLVEKGFATLAVGGVEVELFVPRASLQNQILRRSIPWKLDRRAVRVTSAEDLVLLKMVFGRQKDKRDVAAILFAQKDNLDFEYLRQWSDKTLEDEAGRELSELIAKYATRR